MKHRRTWARPTGSLRSGFQRCWSRTTSRSLFSGSTGAGLRPPCPRWAAEFSFKEVHRMIATASRLGPSHVAGTPYALPPGVGESSGQAAVSCQGVTKEFGANGTKTLALRGVDLEVQDGQMTLLVGPSGCGKTTLISIVAGLLNPTQGSVAVLGTELSKLSGRRLVEFRAKNIGFVFQQYNLLPALSAA